ncbi:MAG: hypothetical protein JO100_12415 [Pseudonocardia sp.]|nr:hypothetical protein [Pseudonocardia sp.]
MDTSPGHALAGEKPAQQTMMGLRRRAVPGAGPGVSGRGRLRAGRIVLLSLWLDVIMAGPEVAEQDARNPYLGARGLAEAGRRWFLLTIWPGHQSTTSVVDVITVGHTCSARRELAAQRPHRSPRKAA